MNRSIRVLVADDEKNLRDLVVRELSRRGLEVEGVGDGEAALARLRENPYDVVVLDMKMPKKEGIEVLRELQEFPEHPQVIVMTGFQEVSTAVEAMKLGAYDYLTKPTKIEELEILVRKAAEKGQLLRDNLALRAHAPGAGPFGGIVTRSQRMNEVLRIVERVAPTPSSVLVLGESGTGKELVARAIHERSGRVERPFVPIHCGALPREVLESELFGHEKGAFTGAVGSKPGLIELADGGTLFLDEIGDMEPDSQVKLLRVLETGMFFRVGGHAAPARGRAAGGRHQSRSGRGDEDGAVPRGSLLSDQHDHREPAAAPRSPGGRHAAGPALPRDQRHLRAEAPEPGRAGRVRGLRLARQRA